MQKTSRKHFNKIAIVGAGLMGMSFARDIKRLKLSKKILGIDRSKKNLLYAKKNGYITESSQNLRDLESADLIVLAIPVIDLTHIIKDVARYASDKALVIDLGSTKATIVNHADHFFKNGNFVACHPMAGREKSGPEAAIEGMFQDASCVIVPGKMTRKINVNRVKTLWKILGSNVLVMDAITHDRYAAACSHLPHVLAFTLVTAVGKTISPVDIHRMAVKSFKSYSRVAGSDAKMWMDIFSDNRDVVLSKIKQFRKELELFESFIEKRQDKKLFQYMRKAATTWKKL